MKYLLIFVGVFITQMEATAQTVSARGEFDIMMQNSVRQINSQLGGLKIDNNMTLKYVTYDSNPPVFTYFYETTLLAYLNQKRLSQTQMDALDKYNINKTCDSNFKQLMNAWNLKIVHLIQDKNDGKIVAKSSITYLDCK